MKRKKPSPYRLNDRVRSVERPQLLGRMRIVVHHRGAADVENLANAFRVFAFGKPTENFALSCGQHYDTC